GAGTNSPIMGRNLGRGEGAGRRVHGLAPGDGAGCRGGAVREGEQAQALGTATGPYSPPLATCPGGPVPSCMVGTVSPTMGRNLSAGKRLDAKVTALRPATGKVGGRERLKRAGRGKDGPRPRSRTLAPHVGAGRERRARRRPGPPPARLAGALG